MGIRDSLEPIIHLLLYAAYGVNVVCGMFLLYAGIYYFSQITGANEFAATVCCAGGLVMMIMGGVGIFANKNRNWLLLAVKLILDFVIFVALMGAFMVSMAILYAVVDPVAKAVFEAYCDEPGLVADYCVRTEGWKPDNVGITLRTQMWPGVVKLFDKGAPNACKVYNDRLVQQEAAGNVHSDSSWAAAGLSVMASVTVVDSAAAGNCTFIKDAQGPSTYDECAECWHQWQLYKIDTAKANLWPSTISIWSLFAFVLVLIFLNFLMLDTEPGEDQTKWKPTGTLSFVALFFNGLVFIFGAIMMGLGIYAATELQDSCPPTKDCTNWAVNGVIFLGLFFMVTSVFSLVGLILGATVGKMMVRIADIAFMILVFILLVVGVGFTIVAGAMDDINTTYDKNFADIRTQYEQEDPGLCLDMDDTACRHVIKGKTEGAMKVIAVTVTIVMAALVFVLFLTFQAVHIYRSADDESSKEEEEAVED